MTETITAERQWLFKVTDEETAPLEAFRKRKGWTRQYLFDRMREEYCKRHGIDYVANGRRIA